MSVSPEPSARARRPSPKSPGGRRQPQGESRSTEGRSSEPISDEGGGPSQSSAETIGDGGGAPSPKTRATAEPSTFELFGRVVTGVVGAFEDVAELLGATIREELARFRRELARHALGIALLIPGVGLVTAAVVLLLQKWLDQWAASLLIVGAFYLLGAVVLMREPKDR